MLYSVYVPLSDHERKLLAEMEAAFQQEDPALVSTLTGKARTRQASRALMGAAILVGGMVILFAGLVAKVILVGLLGFLVALGGAFLLLTNFSFSRGGRNGAAGNKAKKRQSWISRLEERWDRRNFNN